MGYPMTYRRVIGRNHLQGDYVYSIPEGDVWLSHKGLIAGDLRRLEIDQRDDVHLRVYAEKTGLTSEQVKAVLDLFFEGDI